MAQRTSTATMPTTSTRTKVAEESATLALMTLASAATHAQQCKLHEVQVLLALSTENRTTMPAPQRVVTNSPVPVRNFWSAATTSSRAPAGPARALASPPPLSASSSPCTKRRAESTPSGSSVAQEWLRFGAHLSSSFGVGAALLGGAVRGGREANTCRE